MVGSIQLKRVHDPRSAKDGTCFLVERLWPRGVTKSALANTQRLRDAAPSTELRKWFYHDPGRWNDFACATSRSLK